MSSVTAPPSPIASRSRHSCCQSGNRSGEEQPGVVALDVTGIGGQHRRRAQTELRRSASAAGRTLVGTTKPPTEREGFAGGISRQQDDRQSDYLSGSGTAKREQPPKVAAVQEPGPRCYWTTTGQPLDMATKNNRTTDAADRASTHTAYSELARSAARPRVLAPGEETSTTPSSILAERYHQKAIVNTCGSRSFRRLPRWGGDGVEHRVAR
jgi:hypothetical protein